MHKFLILGTMAFIMVGYPALARDRGGGSHSGGDHAVSGHTRSNGSYVKPHHATNRNETRSDNYSTKGNTNPYTGAPGTKD